MLQNLKNKSDGSLIASHGEESKCLNLVKCFAHIIDWT